MLTAQTGLHSTYATFNPGTIQQSSTRSGSNLLHYFWFSLNVRIISSVLPANSFRCDETITNQCFQQMTLSVVRTEKTKATPEQRVIITQISEQYDKLCSAVFVLVLFHLLKCKKRNSAFFLPIKNTNLKTIPLFS